MVFLFYLQTALLAVLVWVAGLLYFPWFQVDPYEYPKVVFFIVATGLLTIVNLIHRFFDETSREGFSCHKLPIEIRLLLLVVVGEILAFIFSTNHLHSLLGDLYRFQGLIVELTTVVYFLNVVYVFLYLPDVFRRRFFVLVSIAALVSAAVSLSPFLFEHSFFMLETFENRVYGALGNPNYLALYLATLIPFFGLYFNSRSKIFRFGSVLSVGFLLVILFLTGSRSAWMSLLFGLFVISIMVARRMKVFRMLMAVLVLFLVILGGLLFQHFHETQVLQRLSFSKNNLGSIMTRVYLQEAGLKLFLERPFFGTGQEMVMDNIEPYLPEYLKANDIFYIDRTHNEFLDILVMQGLVGFIPFLLFWSFLIWSAIIYYMSLKQDTIFLVCLCAVLIIFSNYAVNFAVISGNILLYIFAGYLVAMRYKICNQK